MKTVAIVTLTATLFSLAVQAQDGSSTNTNTNAVAGTTLATSNNSYSDHAGKFGAGAIFGEPTGADVKYWFNEKMAIDGAIGYSWHEDAVLDLQSDILWHAFHLFPLSHGQLPLYFGVGGLARIKNDDNPNEFGIRVPVGISYMFENAPVDIFMEVAPTLDIAPGVRGEVTGGIGVRYWF
jgi:hypothetical protein